MRAKKHFWAILFFPFFCLGATFWSEKVNLIVQADEDIFYASPAGSGDVCGEDNPCSLQTANGLVQAGGRVYLRGGTYENVHINPSSSGSTAQGEVTYQSYPGEEAILIIPQELWWTNKSYIKIKNIKFESDARTWFAFDKDSHHIQLEGCSFHSTREEGTGNWAGISKKLHYHP